MEVPLIRREEAAELLQGRPFTLRRFALHRGGNAQVIRTSEEGKPVVAVVVSPDLRDLERVQAEIEQIIAAEEKMQNRELPSHGSAL